jgi:iron complex outermembrane recepter protein
VTARPAFQFGGRASFTAAECDEFRASGTVTGPISEMLAGRISAYYNDFRGHIRNRGAGGWVNGFASWGVRGKLEWRPTEALTVLATADYRQNDSECCVPVSIATSTPALVRLLDPVVSSRQNREVANDGAGFTYTQQAAYTVQADYDLGWATLTSITALQEYKQDANNEVDNVFNPTPEYVGATGGNAYSKFDLNGGQVHLEQFSQEVRLASPGDQPLTYVVGAYYSWVEVDRPFYRRRAFCPAGTAAQVGQPCPVSQWQSLGAFSLLQSTHHALFGQAEYQVVDKLKLIGGLRVQRERVSVEGFRFGPLFPGDALFSGQPSANAGTNAADTAVTGKAGLQYEFSRDAQAYATYTRGYKGLGIGTEVAADFANQAPILPEHVDAYEIGFKGQTPDRRASIAIALFLADYSNLQVQANRSDPTTGTIRFEQTNAGSSRTKGFEIEGAYSPFEAFSVNASLTYTKATIDIDGLNCPLQFQAAAQIVPLNGARPLGVCYRPTNLNTAGQPVVGTPIQDVRGGDLPATPRWRLTVSPTYRFALGDAWGGTAQLNVSYQSQLNYQLEQDPLTFQKGYALVDASIAFHRRDAGYRLTLFVKNLFDRNYLTSIGHNALLSSATNPNDLQAFVPRNADRYVGATLDVRF